MSRVIVIFAMFALSGCASVVVSDISGKSEYSKIAGHRFALPEHGLVCAESTLGNPDAQPDKDELIITKRNECQYAKKVGSVSPGSLFEVEKVVKHHHIPPLWRHIYLLGKVKMDNGSTHEVFYFYGFDGVEDHERTLWLRESL